MHRRQQLKTEGRFEPIHELSHLFQTSLCIGEPVKEFRRVLNRAWHQIELLAGRIAAVFVPG